ncbi:unnamed protein product, partial [marine sediment metagenome]
LSYFCSSFSKNEDINISDKPSLSENKPSLSDLKVENWWFLLDKLIVMVYNVSIMRFETKSSIYELRKEGNIYVLKKERIKRGKRSSVQAGEEVRGDRVVFTRICTLFMGDRHIIETSKIIKFL